MHKSDYCFLQSRHKHKKRHQEDEFEEELNTLFNKKFRFRFDPDWKLPSPESWFSAPPWKVKELEILKNRLNFHKSQLNDFDIEEWSRHTRRRNPAGEVCWKIRCLVNPEFLTQAWTKFYECLCSYRVVPAAARELVSLHLCEAPGAFITSLNHYLKQNYEGIEWKWLANTLNPYYEGNSPSNMISDDRFMFHTLSHWDFGVDNTGNLMDWRNSQAIVKNARQLGKVLLATADGSIDCVRAPDAQEEATSALHYCELVTALQALGPGGTFVFKLFTTFEHSTIGLLYLTNHLFEEVNVFKPVTSRPGNSEVYAVCLRYRGSHLLADYIPKLKSAYGTGLYRTRSLFPLEDIPASFIKQVEEGANYFCSLQCQVIDNNLQAYLMRNSSPFTVDVRRLRAVVAAEYVRRYDLRPLQHERGVLRGLLPEQSEVNTSPRCHRGSYTERRLYAGMTLSDKCRSLGAALRADLLHLPIFLGEPVRWRSFYEAELELRPAFTSGRPLETVNSSKFIFGPILELYKRILAEEEFVDIVRSSPAASREPAAGTLVFPEPRPAEPLQRVRAAHTLEFPEPRPAEPLQQVRAAHTLEFPEPRPAEPLQQVRAAHTLEFPEPRPAEPHAAHAWRDFRRLLDALRGLAPGDSLLLANFAALTHFNAGVLYVLCKKCFERTGFTADGIILGDMRSGEGLRHLEAVREEGESGRGVWSSVPVRATNVGDFYASLVLYNNTLYRNKCVRYLDLIEQTLCDNERG